MNVAEMKIAIEKIAMNLFARHGGDGWTVSFAPNTGDRAVLGLCSYNSKTVWVNPVILENGEFATAENTIRHECAHVFAGPLAVHGPLWRRWAVICGANATARGNCSDDVKRAIYKWEIAYVCPEKGIEVRTGAYGNRRTNLTDRHVRGNPATKNRLYWAVA